MRTIPCQRCRGKGTELLARYLSNTLDDLRRLGGARTSVEMVEEAARNGERVKLAAMIMRLNRLVAAGFAVKTQHPRPQNNVRWLYSAMEESDAGD